MHIIDYMHGFYIIDMTFQSFRSRILYNPEERHLKFTDDGEFSDIIKLNEYQLRKILHNKKPETFFKGFRLRFVLRDNKKVIAFNDLSKLIVYDHTDVHPVIEAIDYYNNDFITVYTDGSYSEKKEKCSYVFLLKNTNNLLDIRFGVKNAGKSSFIELTAVMEALKYLKNEKKIRIVTDSRYVIKGLTEWIYNWRLNNWFTAQGKKVKNIALWKAYQTSAEGKYIEFDWVKAHSFHFENTICDKYAKELLKRCL